MLFYFINMIAQKIPLRPLFIITSAFLFAMAIKFIGEAVQEFQEQAILPFTELKSLEWFGAIGLNPTVEALSAQLLVIVLALATYWVFLRNSRLARDEKAMRTAKPEPVRPCGERKPNSNHKRRRRRAAGSSSRAAGCRNKGLDTRRNGSSHNSPEASPIPASPG